MDNCEAGSDFLVSSSQAAEDVSKTFGIAGFACCRCKERKTRCYSQNLVKNIGSSACTQACDRCRVRKMRCDDQMSGSAPCIQNQSECKTTDRVTGKITVRGYVHSVERKLEKLQIRNRELESLRVSLGQDVKPYTDDDDPPLSPWHRSSKDLPTGVVLPPTSAKPTHFSKFSHNSHEEAVLQVDASADQSLHREPASVSLENYSNRAEDPYDMPRPPPHIIPKFSPHEQQRSFPPRPRSLYRGDSPPTVAVPVRSVIKAVELAYREAEELLCWIADTQKGKRVLTFTKLLKNSLSYNTQELEAAILIREEGYGRKLWFSLEDGIATEALKIFLVYFQDKVLRSLWSIRDYDSKVDLRNLVDAANFARMESIAALDESSLRLAQAATVAKRLVEESGMQTSQFTPKSPASENLAALVPVTTLRTDATTPITNPGSDKNCQRSRNKTRKRFDNDGHKTIESNIVKHERRALVGDHESLRDNGGATKAYQAPKGKPTTTTNIRQPPSKGRVVGRNFRFAPISSSSDTSSMYSGHTYGSSTYGSKDDSSMTSGEVSQMEPQQSINDAAVMDGPVKTGTQGTLASEPSSPTIPLYDRVKEHLEGHARPPLLLAPSFAQCSSSGPERSGQQARTISDLMSEIELLGDEFDNGKTENNMESDIKPIAAREALSDETGKSGNELIEGLKEESIVHNVLDSPRLPGNRPAGHLAGGYSTGQPTDGPKLPKHAEDLQLEANDENLPSCVGKNDHNPIIRMRKCATQSKGHDELDLNVRVLSWRFLFKHVFPLAVLMGTDFIQRHERNYYKSMNHSQTMNEKYNVCVTSVQMVAWIAVLYSTSKLLKSKLRMLASRHGRNRNHEIGNPTSTLSKSLRTLYGQEYTAFNSAKRYVEYLTGKHWDWWPFVASFRLLQPDEVRVEWECESRHTHWSEIPREKVHLMFGPSGANVPVKAAMQPSSATLAGHKAASKSSSSSQTSHSRSSDGRSSPATSDTGSSSPPSDNAECDDGSLEQEKYPSGDVIAVNIVPPSKLNGYVLFGVQGSKRLQSSKTQLTQIDVNVCKDDDSFFDEMKVQYKQLRGYVRWIFSIWVFHTCEFVMFYKANPNEVMPGPEEMPSVTDLDYRFAADRYPPVLSSVFNISFYGCEKACIKSRLDVMDIFHECKSRNHCGKYRVLERLPKRLRKWEIDRDEEKDEAWGLNATFGVAFYKVAVYHLLILVGPMTFWGVWLRRWPTDWQNASVPFFAVVVLLSLFWLPFAQKVDFKEKVKHKIT